MINSESPTVNINTQWRSRAETLPTFSHGQGEDNSSSSTAISTPRVSERDYFCRTEILYSTARNNLFYPEKKGIELLKKMRSKILSTCPVCFTTPMESFPC